MTNLIFNYQPGKNVSLYATSTAIEKFYKKLGSSFSQFETGKNDSYIMQMHLEVRNCTAGEIMRRNPFMFLYRLTINLNFYLWYRCQECQVGEYSLLDGMTAKECIKCPKFTIYCYKNIIVLQSGFLHDFYW